MPGSFEALYATELFDVLDAGLVVRRARPFVGVLHVKVFVVLDEVDLYPLVLGTEQVDFVLPPGE